MITNCYATAGRSNKRTIFGNVRTREYCPDFHNLDLMIIFWTYTEFDAVRSRITPESTN